MRLISVQRSIVVGSGWNIILFPASMCSFGIHVAFDREGWTTNGLPAPFFRNRSRVWQFVIGPVLLWVFKRRFNRPLDERAELNEVMAHNKGIAVDYFKQNPDKTDGVLKAYYAYHAPHFRLDDKAHNFPSHQRFSKCVWCGRSREAVRFDALPYACQRRPELPEAEGVVLEEERKAFKLSARAEQLVNSTISKKGLSGIVLADLHRTHGIDPETASVHTPIPEEVLKDYEAIMDKERADSRENRVVQIIKPV